MAGFTRHQLIFCFLEVSVGIEKGALNSRISDQFNLGRGAALSLKCVVTRFRSGLDLHKCQDVDHLVLTC